MSIELETALYDKCATDPRLALLHAQWSFDKTFLSQALHNIGNAFPHYSLHEATHSNTILIQIVRLLGDRIRQLSATDIWLILESAYWHDSGMLIDHATRVEWWGKPEFREFLLSLAEGLDLDLAKASRLLLREGRISSNPPFELCWATTLVFAEFGRRIHAKRAAEIVAKPTTIGIDSPRILIPRRLFDWVGTISMSHGENEEFVLGLPYQENGIGSDLCHPRFVSALLRLGDLLDLDNGRFCPVKLKMISPTPNSTVAHLKKHASIKRFMVTPQKIEVHAFCDSSYDESDLHACYEAHEVIANWFEWLEKEIKFLAATWADIAPPDFGSPPSLGEIKNELKNDIYLNNRKRPRFQVDEAAFIKLTHGTNLYADSNAWLREVIANAEDATRIRMFQEKFPQGKASFGLAKQATLEKLRQLLSHYPIEIDLTYTHDPSLSREYVCFKITDSGTGISEQDLPFILTIGSSQKNPNKRRIVESIPELFKPSGAFGIGLQSLFLVTNKIIIRTRHFNTKDNFEITIQERSAENEYQDPTLTAYQRNCLANVFVRRLDATCSLNHPGTEISFRITKTPNLPIPIRKSNPKSYRKTAMAGGIADPVLNDQGAEMSLDSIRSGIEEISAQTLATLKVNRNTVNSESVFQDEFTFFCHAAGCLLKIVPCHLGFETLRLLYRGSEIVNFEIPTIPFLKLSLDIHAGKASTYLTASRDRLIKSAEELIKHQLRASLIEAFPTFLSRLTPAHKPRNGQRGRKVGSTLDFPASSRDRKKYSAQASLVAFLYFDLTQRNGGQQAWLNFEVFESQGKPITLSKIARLNRFFVRISRQGAITRTSPNSFVLRDKNRFCIGEGFSVTSFQILRDVLPKLDLHSTFVGRDGNYDVYFVSTEQPQNMPDECLYRLLRDHSIIAPSFQAPGAWIRPVYPAAERFVFLHHDSKHFIPTKDRNYWLTSNLLISPFRWRLEYRDLLVRVSLRGLVQFIEWSRNNHASQSRATTSSFTNEIILDELNTFVDAIVLAYRKSRLKVQFEDANSTLSPENFKERLKSLMNE